MGPTWGPPGSCRPQMGPMLAPWTWLLQYSRTTHRQRRQRCCSTPERVFIIFWRKLTLSSVIRLYIRRTHWFNTQSSHLLSRLQFDYSLGLPSQTCHFSHSHISPSYLMQSRGAQRLHENMKKADTQRSWPVFAKPYDGWAPKFSHSLEAAIYGFRVDSIALKLEWCLNNTAADVHLRFHRNTTMLTPDLAASSLREILRLDVSSLCEKWPWGPSH